MDSLRIASDFPFVVDEMSSRVARVAMTLVVENWVLSYRSVVNNICMQVRKNDGRRAQDEFSVL